MEEIDDFFTKVKQEVENANGPLNLDEVRKKCDSFINQKFDEMQKKMEEEEEERRKRKELEEQLMKEEQYKSKIQLGKLHKTSLKKYIRYYNLRDATILAPVKESLKEIENHFQNELGTQLNEETEIREFQNKLFEMSQPNMQTQKIREKTPDIIFR